MSSIAQATLDLVRRRAGHRCEYCRLPQSVHDQPFSVDHITARKHGGGDEDTNLALCCLRCNLRKGTDLTGIDPVTQQIAVLFHPRRNDWDEHFRWDGASIVGVTQSERVTVQVLQMNDPVRLRLRESLIREGLLP
ncbi:MAG TPA: HNH endonuclease signature motif containing protein [Tepidisphaeraceae bacterium]|nr:HNH endonuclease signature motif containing protein [Tepidisphaeraceae bacterium]